MPTTTLAHEANLTVLVGRSSAPPDRRTLPVGRDRPRPRGGRPAGCGPNDSVNVAWYGAPAAAERWLDGEQILVTGRTRRRFFRVGGVTQSRTEVVATAGRPHPAGGRGPVRAGGGRRRAARRPGALRAPRLRPPVAGPR